MEFLLNRKLFPITDTLCFLETTPEHAARGFNEFYEDQLDKLGVTISIKNVSGTLEDILYQLLPLTIPYSTRHLFIPTKSQWCAYFNNFSLGTDSNGLQLWIAKERLNCRATRALYQTDKHQITSLYWDVFSPDSAPFLNVRRVIHLTKLYRWEFETFGEPFAFEHIDRYTSKKRKERFTLEMLDEYLRAFEISAFDDTFYIPKGTEAILVEWQGVKQSNRECSLEEIQAQLKI